MGAKTFLSIGSGPGMGLATAERFAEEGFTVVLSARNLAKTTALAAQLVAKGHKAEARVVDAGDALGVASLISEVETQHGGIDVLHYNAATIRRETLAAQPRDTFSADLAVNIGGALVAAQALASGMSERGYGTILLTGGGFALHPSAEYLSLSIGKAGIRALAHGLFESFRAKGIHVATVTVLPYVFPGTKDAQAVAELFWQLHSQPKGSWTAEMMYPA